MKYAACSSFFAIALIGFSCMSSQKDIDGNNYTTVQIGNQEWMGENLAVKHFRNGDTIPEAKSEWEWILCSAEGKPACCALRYDEGSVRKYGMLYNWAAVTDPRGLAPGGWHVATDEEWKELTDFLGGEIQAAFAIRTSGLSGKGKGEMTGFSGIPAGCCNSYGVFYGAGSHGYWWTSTESTKETAWLRMLNYEQVGMNSIKYDKRQGLSVRCIKDK
jgi:uncharacterized protein (TIGR02145 family)